MRLSKGYRVSAERRDRAGEPVASAETYNDEPSRVAMMGSDRSRGILHAVAVTHVLRGLKHAGATLPSGVLSPHSQRMFAHATDEHTDTNKIEAYMQRRAARVAKAHTVTPERRHELSRRYPGFQNDYSYDLPRGIGSTSAHLMVRHAGTGKPGLTVTHRDYGYNTPPNQEEECPSQGVGCKADHRLTYRKKDGTPVTTSTLSQQGGNQRPMVSGLYSDGSHGLAHAIGVGHITNHLDKIGVEPDHSLSGFSQRLVSHGFEMKDQGKDSRLKDYIERRAARVAKGYKLTPEGSATALAAAHGYASSMDRHERREFATEVLERIPKGKPGLSIHRHKAGSGGSFSGGARWSGDAGSHTIVYRDSQGKPVTAAHVRTHRHILNMRDAGRKVEKLAQPYVTSMASDRSRGAIHAIGVGHVARTLGRMGITTSHELTSDSQKMIAHGIDLGEKRSTLMNYMAARARRTK